MVNDREVTSFTNHMLDITKHYKSNLQPMTQVANQLTDLSERMIFKKPDHIKSGGITIKAQLDKTNVNI